MVQEGRESKNAEQNKVTKRLSHEVRYKENGCFILGTGNYVTKSQQTQ